MVINKHNTHPYVRPKNAATLIIIDLSHPIPRILMGKRNYNLSFMPGKFVFPGGRVEAGDLRLKVTDVISRTDKRKFLKGSPKYCSHSHGFALAAIRETYEETGILIGESSSAKIKTRSKAWLPFLNEGIIPTPSKVQYCARAITPTNNTKRFDTRFFYVDADYIAKQNAFVAGEFEDIVWVSLDKAHEIGVAKITGLILNDIYKGFLNNTLFTKHFKMPFYYTKNGAFQRDIMQA